MTRGKSVVDAPEASDRVLHRALVALTLAGVERLQIAFFQASSAILQQQLLLAAGDTLDRTLPDQDLKADLSSLPPDRHVAKLIEQRSRISAIPPKFWRAPRVSPNDLGQAHYSGYRALERLLRRTRDEEGLAWTSVSKWLSPVWSKYPELEREAQFVANTEQNLLF